MIASEDVQLLLSRESDDVRSLSPSDSTCFTNVKTAPSTSHQTLYPFTSSSGSAALASSKISKSQLDIYVLDYLRKNNFSSELLDAFIKEGSVLGMNISSEENQPPIDISGGFLLEWWNLFWDITATKSLEQIKEYSSSLKRLDKSSPILTNASSSYSIKKSKSEVNMEAILEAQKAQVAAAQAITLKQQEILNATLASHTTTRQNSMSMAGAVQVTPPVVQPSMHPSSMLTPDFDSLNLEERKIWLQQMQQHNSYMASFSNPRLSQQQLMMAPSMSTSAYFQTPANIRTAPPTYQWVAPPAQPYSMMPPVAAGPLFGNVAVQPTPPFYYNPSHRFTNTQTVPTTPQYIKPAPVPPTSSSNDSNNMTQNGSTADSQLNQQAASTAGLNYYGGQQPENSQLFNNTTTQHYLSGSNNDFSSNLHDSAVMDPSALLSKTTPASEYNTGNELSAHFPSLHDSSMGNAAAVSANNKYGLMNDSLMNESLFLDLDDIFFANGNSP